MKTKIICLLFCVALIFGALPVSAAQSADYPSFSELLQEQLESNKLTLVQEYLDLFLCQSVGAGAEPFVLSLIASGQAIDYKSYIQAVNEALASEDSVLSAATGQNLAFMLLVCGQEVSGDLVADTAGNQGIMSLVYALHLSNRGFSYDGFDDDAIAKELVKLQLKDGGWSVYGTVSDPDVTSMTLQALAGYAKKTGLSESIEKALGYLSRAQLADGGFAAYGKANCESTAQVAVALCSLGIDPLKDSRFIKNGSCVFDALMLYRTDTGFSHLQSGKTQSMPTGQSLLAFSALERFLKAESSVFEAEIVNYTPQNTSQTSVTSSAVAVTTGLADEPYEPGYKSAAIAVVFLLALIAVLILIIFKKRHRNNFIAVVLIGIILITVILFTDIKTVDDFYSPETKGAPVGQVTMSITCNTVAGKDSNAPQDGIILKKTELDLYEGESVYDLLVRAARENRLRIDVKGAGAMAYVSGIESLYEFDHGELSGWMYYVNGAEADVGCGEYVLSDGDRISWMYSVQMGKEL